MQHVVDVHWEVLVQADGEDQLAINGVQSPEIHRSPVTLLKTFCLEHKHTGTYLWFFETGSIKNHQLYFVYKRASLDLA